MMDVEYQGGAAIEAEAGFDLAFSYLSTNFMEDINAEWAQQVKQEDKSVTSFSTELHMSSSTLSEESSNNAETINHDFIAALFLESPDDPSTSSSVDSDEKQSDERHYECINKAKKRKSNENIEPGSGLNRRVELSIIKQLFEKKMKMEITGLVKKAKRRVGPTVPDLGTERIKWDPSLEVIYEKEPVDWLENNHIKSLDLESMVLHWLNRGPKDEETQSLSEFIDKEILNNIIYKNGFFDKISDHEFRLAVRRSNPFQSIQEGIFLNQDALKMANMDYAFDYMFTNPKHRDNTPMVKDNELLYFADVCAGPGGFSEYVLFRKKWRAKGIGFILKGDDDIKLEDFRAGPCEFLEPFYGLKNDGNLYDPHNITKLTEFVMEVTNGKGVHFMMADGGSPAEGKRNIQESKQLYLCQFLTTLNIVREEGHLVCKVFDLFSEFSAGLIYLMYRAFHKISIFKPNTSPSSNSERYIICKHKRNDTKAIEVYLYEISFTLWKYSDDSKVVINSWVPKEVMKDDFTFINYLRDSNNRLGKKQIVNLDKIAAYYQDESLHEPRQNELRTRCMQLWNVPTSLRKTDEMTVTEALKFIMQTILKFQYKSELVPEILNTKGKSLTSNNLESIFNYSILDWQCIPLGSDSLCFLLGLGKNRVYCWAGSHWEPVANMELPAGTLIYGQFLYEYREEESEQTRNLAYHIIDGFALDFKPIAHHPYDERLAMLKLFSKALLKWNDRSLCPIRVEMPTPLKHINWVLPRIKKHLIQSSQKIESCLFSLEYPVFMEIKGLMFVRTTREPWHKYRSKLDDLDYYFNSESKESLFAMYQPDETVASTLDALKNQVLWQFQPGAFFNGELLENNILHEDYFFKFIDQKNSEM